MNTIYEIIDWHESQKSGCCKLLNGYLVQKTYTQISSMDEQHQVFAIGLIAEISEKYFQFREMIFGGWNTKKHIETHIKDFKTSNSFKYVCLLSFNMSSYVIEFGVWNYPPEFPELATFYSQLTKALQL